MSHTCRAVTAHKWDQSRRRCRCRLAPAQHGPVPAQTWTSPGTDACESRRRFGQAPAQMLVSRHTDVGSSPGADVASPGAKVGKPARRCARPSGPQSEVASSPIDPPPPNRHCSAEAEAGVPECMHPPRAVATSRYLQQMCDDPRPILPTRQVQRRAAAEPVLQTDRLIAGHSQRSRCCAPTGSPSHPSRSAVSRCWCGRSMPLAVAR